MATSSLDSSADFQSPSQNEVPQHLNKKRRAGIEKQSVTDEEERKADTPVEDIKCLECPVCLEPITNQGDHQATAIGCGHIFGLSCLVQNSDYFRTKQIPLCPLCRKRYAKSDLRHVFLPAVHNVLDVSLVEVEKELREQTEERLEEKTKALDSALCVNNQNMVDCSHLKHRVDELQKKCNQLESKLRARGTYNEDESVDKPDFVRSKSIQVSSNKSARVMCLPKRNSNLVAVSSEVVNQPAFQTVKILDLNAPSNRNHTEIKAQGFSSEQKVRGLCFDKTDKLLLTVFSGGKMCLYDVRGTSNYAAMNLDGSSWACTWDSTNENLFYCGANSSVNCFDKRKMNQKLWSKVTDCGKAFYIHSYQNQDLLVAGLRGIGILTPSSGITSSIINSSSSSSSSTNSYSNSSEDVGVVGECYRSYHMPFPMNQIRPAILTSCVVGIDDSICMVSCRKNGLRPYYNHVNLNTNRNNKQIHVNYGINGGNGSSMPSLSKTYLYVENGKIYFCAPNVRSNNTKVVDIWNLSKINTNHQVNTEMMYDSYEVDQSIDMYNDLAVDITGDMCPIQNFTRKLLVLTSSMLHVYI